jgi:hypothetical protein
MNLDNIRDERTSVTERTLVANGAFQNLRAKKGRRL